MGEAHQLVFWPAVLIPCSVTRWRKPWHLRGQPTRDGGPRRLAQCVWPVYSTPAARYRAQCLEVCTIAARWTPRGRQRRADERADVAGACECAEQEIVFGSPPKAEIFGLTVNDNPGANAGNSYKKKSGRRYGRPLHQVMDSGSRKFILDELRERVTGISVMTQVLAV